MNFQNLQGVWIFHCSGLHGNTDMCFSYKRYLVALDNLLHLIFDYPQKIVLLSMERSYVKTIN